MTNAQPENTGESKRYWTHGVNEFPSPVAQFRMAQLIDMDDRLYETARVVYRFMVGWYHDGYGDALLSQRHVAKVMKQRAPDCAVVPSRNAVQRAILALMETGWVVRSFQGRGRGKGASRYVPVMNVLELAAQGKFPQPAHATGPVQPAHAIGPVVAHATGPVDAEPAHATGPKTLPPDTATEPMTGMVEVDFAPPVHGLAAGPVAKGGFEELFESYGVRKDKADARRAYDKLGPNAELHARMVESATAWRAAAGSIERMRLRRWIEEERYDEEPKGESKRSAAKPAAIEAEPEPEDNSIPDWLQGSPSLWPVGRHEGEFVDAPVETDGQVESITLSFQASDGKVYKHHFYTQASIQSFQDEGQATLSRICSALGLDSIDDTDELLHKPLAAIADGRKLTYLPLREAA